MQQRKENLEEAIALLPQWYGTHARDLPWRADREPYHVWISEIMLQQTRVEAVKAYYIRFMEALPSIRDLAECEEALLLKLWEGLGYYSRARNLHRAAQTVMDEYGGRFPDTYEEIRKLSGIGPYTAGAVASIAFREPAAAVDGNVLRVLARLQNDARDISDPAVKKERSAQIRAFLQTHPQEDPGIVNQALMELGAVVCVPNGEPHCGDCPWGGLCRARSAGTTAERPVRKKAKPRRVQHRTVLLITDGERVLMHRRSEEGLLSGMDEPVNLEGEASADEIPDIVRAYGLDPLRVIKAPQAKHIFTHLEWEMTGYLVRITQARQEALPAGCFFADREMLSETCAVPAAFKVYREWILERMG